MKEIQCFRGGAWSRELKNITIITKKPELQIEDDRIRESTKNMMAKIFGVEPDNLVITQNIMAIGQKIMNIISSLRIKKMQMDASDMPIMYGRKTVSPYS